MFIVSLGGKLNYLQYIKSIKSKEKQPRHSEFSAAVIIAVSRFFQVAPLLRRLWLPALAALFVCTREGESENQRVSQVNHTFTHPLISLHHRFACFNPCLIPWWSHSLCYLYISIATVQKRFVVYHNLYSAHPHTLSLVYFLFVSVCCWSFIIWCWIKNTDSYILSFLNTLTLPYLFLICDII